MCAVFSSRIVQVSSSVGGVPVLATCQSEMLFLAFSTLHCDGGQLGLHLSFGDWSVSHPLSASRAGWGVSSGPASALHHASPSGSHGKEECDGKSNFSGWEWR